MQAHGINLAAIVNLLVAFIGAEVVDQTGLKGLYDFDLEYAPDEPQRPASPAPEVSAPVAIPKDPEGLPLLTAVQAQLGLKLVSGKGPIDVVVVDHIEPKPTAN